MELKTMAAVGDVSCCATCKKPKVTPWTCEVCEHAGLKVEVCSTRCMRVHERNGRHRKELRAQQAKAIVPDAPPRRGGGRARVRIIRRKVIGPDSMR